MERHKSDIFQSSILGSPVAAYGWPCYLSVRMFTVATSMLAFTDADRWVPGIGDPTFIGWFTVVAYFWAMIFAGLNAWEEKRASTGRGLSSEALFWFALTGFLLFLGINKQLDLQTWFTLFFKGLAKSQGWYERRRIYQILFIFGIALAGVLVLLMAWWSTRKTIRRHFLALLGCVFLGCFILVRASSFHQVDQFLGMTFANFKMNWILELSGIFCVGWCAYRNWRRLKKRSRETGFIWVTAGDRLPE